MLNGEQVPVANRSWLLPGVENIYPRVGGYAIIATDFDGNIQTYNKEVIKMYGYKREEILGGKMNIEVFFPKYLIEFTRNQNSRPRKQEICEDILTERIKHLSITNHTYQLNGDNET